MCRENKVSQSCTLDEEVHAPSCTIPHSLAENTKPHMVGTIGSLRTAVVGEMSTVSWPSVLYNRFFFQSLMTFAEFKEHADAAKSVYAHVTYRRALVVAAAATTFRRSHNVSSPFQLFIITVRCHHQVRIKDLPKTLVAELSPLQVPLDDPFVASINRSSTCRTCTKQSSIRIFFRGMPTANAAPRARMDLGVASARSR